MVNSTPSVSLYPCGRFSWSLSHRWQGKAHKCVVVSNTSLNCILLLMFPPSGPGRSLHSLCQKPRHGGVALLQWWLSDETEAPGRRILHVLPPLLPQTRYGGSLPSFFWVGVNTPQLFLQSKCLCKGIACQDAPGYCLFTDACGIDDLSCFILSTKPLPIW